MNEIDLENQIEKLETNMFQMERKNNYIKNMLKNFIEIAKSYKIIDREQTGLQSKLTKSINDIKDITIAGIIVYKFITLVIFMTVFVLLSSPSAPYLYFLFENCFFISIFYEGLSQMKQKNSLFEPEESLVVKESREKIEHMNTDQKYLNSIIRETDICGGGTEFECVCNKF